MLLTLLLLLLASPLASHAQQPSQQSPVQGMHRAQKHVSRQIIDQLEETWRQAILHADIPTLENLLADDYMAISSNGMLQNREQTLANLRSGKVHFTSIELSDRKVRFYGTTALVTSLASMSGVNAEGPIGGDFRYTRVYVRNERGAWKVVSFEVNRIREPGEKR
jgi:ketosteroid isomerase-like protein